MKIYAVCPTCKSKKIIEKITKVESAIEKYGVSGVDQFLDDIQDLAIENSTPEQENLIVDCSAEIKEMVLQVNYHCKCSVCNFEFQLTKEFEMG